VLCSHGNQFGIRGGRLTIVNLSNRRLTETAYNWHNGIEATGEDISTRAMMEYFKPLMSWLEEQNKGRQIGWE
jgi:hypothetical protein